MALEQELQTFQKELPALLTNAANRGRFALVHGDAVAGVYPSVDTALDAGYDRFGLETFLVKEITEHEEPKYFSRNITRCP